MTGRDLGAVLAVAEEAARWAQRHITSRRPGPGDPEEKAGPGDWVTSVDREVEEHIRAALLAAFPGDVVIGEEAGRSVGAGQAAAGAAAAAGLAQAGDGGLTWYIDPIDGTTNFVHGLPGVSVSIAAVDAAGVAVGVVHDVYRDEAFSAIRGRGARVDGVTVAVGDEGERVGLRGGLLLTEWSGLLPWPGMYGLITDLQGQFTATRVLGSCALSLASVGAGRATGAVLGGRYNPWDVLAGALIAAEAGCVVFDADGVAGDVPMGGLGVARPDVADAIRTAWQDARARAAAAGQVTTGGAGRAS
ncbi:inositol monophosphatase family protein [Jiangella muralis]|uniref:inositol monophosphatase family protein n=1 Tax=Jiangella muralis TaxID=702383 RepID=UPI00069CE1E0|nr:inositol monophosphatase family protein [Jiangella muralis]